MVELACRSKVALITVSEVLLCTFDHDLVRTSSRAKLARLELAMKKIKLKKKAHPMDAQNHPVLSPKSDPDPGPAMNLVEHFAISSSNPRKQPVGPMNSNHRDTRGISYAWSRSPPCRK